MFGIIEIYDIQDSLDRFDIFRHIMPIVEKTLNDLPPLDEQRFNKLRAMKDKDIDTSDMPALTQEQLARFMPAKLLNRSLYRPLKVPVKINYDADVLEWFRSFGKGYQTRMNTALREYMLTHCGN